MAKDKQGNDLANVGVPVTGAICIVPYAEDNVITRTMISKKNATPKLPEVYARGTSCLGLIAGDGAPQDSTEKGDPHRVLAGGRTPSTARLPSTRPSPSPRTPTSHESSASVRSPMPTALSRSTPTRPTPSGWPTRRSPTRTATSTDAPASLK